MLVNVKTAFLYTTQSDRCTLTCLGKLPWIGKLERAMWYSRKTPLDMKFKESVTPSRGCFVHETRDMFLCAHVDDLLRTGQREDLLWLKKQLLKQC